MDKIKAIALYLPQFHRIPENDEWWGEGFTEWTAVKNSIPLFQQHCQPKKPLYNNYYNLLDKHTMQWQASLAKDADVYGFCFYHYWFKDGRKILEKPAENLLHWKDINMPFCFSWANETWARSWSNVNRKNVWSDILEVRKGEEQNKTGILLEQKYGMEGDWKSHFEYLLPFFKDERYIKLDGKPVFLIHQADLIPCLDKIVSYWKKISSLYGLPGLYIIVSNCVKIKWKSIDARIVHEPGTSMLGEYTKANQRMVRINKVKTFSYDDIWKNILETRYNNEEKTYLCGFVDYDDTPRRGVNGSVVKGASVKKFYKYYKLLIEKSLQWDNEFVFINAWNEWGEGMYLEPDEKNGYGYLKAFKKAIGKGNKLYKVKKSLNIFQKYIKLNQNMTVDLSQEYVGVGNRIETEKIIKYRNYMNLLNHWLVLKEQGITLDKYLIHKGYCKIAIYGMGIMGKHLVEDLRNSNVEIIYAIDKKADMLNTSINIVNPEDELFPVDAIIVTATFDFNKIEEQLNRKTDSPIISLEEIVYES